MSKHKGVQFNCFSPPVMVATLIIELCLAAYTLWRYKMNNLARLVVISLVCLATFQLSEYHVCTGYGLSAENWSRLGFIAITALPALGLHILHLLAGKPQRKLVAAGYACMAGFMLYFMLYQAAFIGHQCTGNYVIFQIGARPALAYGLYYYGLLGAGLYLGTVWAAAALAQQGKKAKLRVQAVRGLVIGYLIFLVPTAIANTVTPATRQAIPSIMCGFAVLFALILTFYIMPRAGKPRTP